MARSCLQFLPILSLILFTLLESQSYARTLQGSRQVYIVLVSCELNSTRSAYLYLLNKVLEDIKPEDALIYSYRAAACGFAAKLTQKEAKKLQGVDGVLEVIRSMTYHLDDGMSSAAFIDGPV
ncbi:hypothetical protein SLE2022_108350 [Rubroshorea leprosula]